MAYSEGLADDIRVHLADIENLSERKMFGGIAVMVDGNMAVGVTGDELMVRIGKDAHEEAIARHGARTFDLSAKPMQGWVVVSADGLATDADANSWIDQGVAFARTLPPK